MISFIRNVHSKQIQRQKVDLCLPGARGELRGNEG